MKRLNEHHLNHLTCRICNASLEAVTNPRGGDIAPTTGSFSICVRCGEVSVIEVAEDGIVSLREPNFVELAIFTRENADIIAAFNHMRAHHRP